MTKEKDSPAAVVERRSRYLSPSVDTLQIYHGEPFVVSHGEMQYLYDHAGRHYLDCTAQNVCISLGFGHPLTVAMVSEQVRRMAHCTTLFHHDLPGRYAEELLATMPSGDWVVHLVNSGSEAIDLAYAMARCYTGHYELLSLRNAYHGAHFSATATTAFDIMRPAIAGAGGFVQVIHPDQYRGAFGAGLASYVAEIGRTIESATCGRVAGMIIEPIQGFGGVVPMPAGYMEAAYEVVRAAGGVAIVDEVQTGFGRLGSHYWGFEAHEVTPDIVVLGKGMGNGLPVAGVIARRDIAAAFAQVKFFNTFGSNPVAVAAARSVVRGLREEDRQAHARRCGSHFGARLAALQERHEAIGDVRGTGLFYGVDIVRDRISREPDRERAQRVQRRLRDAGFIMVAGSRGRNVLRFNPPFCITLEDIDRLADALDRALAEP